MKHLFTAAVAALALASIAGCASINENKTTAKIAVTYAAMKYIDQASPTEKVARAARVVAVANEALNAIQGDGFELGAFTRHIIQNLPADLAPSDRVLAMALISVVGNELNGRIIAGKLTPETRLKVRQVLEWILEATAYYES